MERFSKKISALEDEKIARVKINENQFWHSVKFIVWWTFFSAVFLSLTLEFCQEKFINTQEEAQKHREKEKDSLLSSSWTVEAGGKKESYKKFMQFKRKSSPKIKRMNLRIMKINCLRKGKVRWRKFLTYFSSSSSFNHLKITN